MTTGAASSPGTGYRVVLPPGWVRIPLREGTERAIDAVLEPKFAGLPTDSYGPVRAELRKRLLAQVGAARQNQGIDLCLPEEQIGGVTVAASVVVGIVDSPASESATADDVLDYVAAIPDESDRWPTLSFSTLADGDPTGPVADLLVELFDAIVGTLRRVHS